jgi:hypothetical protein
MEVWIWTVRIGRSASLLVVVRHRIRRVKLQEHVAYAVPFVHHADARFLMMRSMMRYRRTKNGAWCATNNLNTIEADVQLTVQVTGVLLLEIDGRLRRKLLLCLLNDLARLRARRVVRGKFQSRAFLHGPVMTC